MHQTAIDKIKELVAKKKPKELKRYLSTLQMNELSEAWDDLDAEEAITVFSAFDGDKKISFVPLLSVGQQEELIKSLTAENMKILLEEMDPDDLTDFIQSVSAEVRAAVWQTLGDEAKEETKFLLRFDEDEAAGLMTPRYLALRPNLTVGQALTWIRKSARTIETVYYVYILDQIKRLVGVVSLRDLLSAEDSNYLDNVAVKNVVSVHEETDQEEVAKILETYDLIALPVVDRYNRMLGIVTFDDVLDVIRQEQTEDIYKMGAMEGSPDRYLESSPWTLVKKRIPWLVVLLLAATITSNVLAHYQSVIQVAVVLAFFIPIVTGTGGNSGTQSATLMIRGLATGEVHFHDLFRVLAKEVLVGASIGITLGILTVARSVFLPPFVSIHEALAVGIAMAFVVIVATLIGAFAPLLISRMGFDPTVMAGPLMATIIDVSGLTIYFEVARLLLAL